MLSHAQITGHHQEMMRLDVTINNTWAKEVLILRSPSLWCVSTAVAENTWRKTLMLNKTFYFYLITCNSCVPLQNLVFPVALIHLRLNYWLCWRARNWGFDWSKGFRRNWPLYKEKKNIREWKLINEILKWMIWQRNSSQ